MHGCSLQGHYCNYSSDLDDGRRCEGDATGNALVLDHGDEQRPVVDGLRVREELRLDLAVFHQLDPGLPGPEMILVKNIHQLVENCYCKDETPLGVNGGKHG